MAERNPIVPVKNQSSKPDGDVVSWPNPVEQAAPVPDEIVAVRERQTTEDPAQRAKAVVQDAASRAGDSMRDIQREVAHKTRLAIDRLRILADERPLQFIATVAAIAFVAGVGLRLWRSTHE